MEKLLEVLQKVDRALEQGLIGRARVASNLVYAKKLLVAVREADLGNDSNAVLDELVQIVDKSLKFVGPSASDQ